jgi:hypothetical protein
MAYSTCNQRLIAANLVLFRVLNKLFKMIDDDHTGHWLMIIMSEVVAMGLWPLSVSNSVRYGCSHKVTVPHNAKDTSCLGCQPERQVELELLPDLCFCFATNWATCDIWSWAEEPGTNEQSSTETQMKDSRDTEAMLGLALAYRAWQCLWIITVVKNIM